MKGQIWNCGEQTRVILASNSVHNPFFPVCPPPTSMLRTVNRVWPMARWELTAHGEEGLGNRPLQYKLISATERLGQVPGHIM